MQLFLLTSSTSDRSHSRSDRDDFLRLASTAAALFFSFARVPLGITCFHVQHAGHEAKPDTLLEGEETAAVVHTLNTRLASLSRRKCSRSTTVLVVTQKNTLSKYQTEPMPFPFPRQLRAATPALLPSSHAPLCMPSHL
jgi:hypothetical protein